MSTLSGQQVANSLQEARELAHTHSQRLICYQKVIPIVQVLPFGLALYKDRAKAFMGSQGFTKC